MNLVNSGGLTPSSALETLLILTVNCFPEKAVATGHAPKKNGKAKPLLDWDLSALLKVAKAAGWLPSGLALDDRWCSRKALVGDYAEVVRMARNLAHPARYGTH